MAQGTTKGVPIDIDPLLTADSDLLVPSQKAIKTYTDTGLSGKVNRSGDTMSGSLLLVANPTAPLEAATKDYVDTLINGIDWKASANAATVAALPTYNVTGSGQILTGAVNGAIPSATTDGVTLTATQRLLVKNETSTLTPNNGIYVVTQVGSGSLPFILTRSSDANTSALLAEATLSVSAGSTLANTQWHCNPATIPLVIGTTYITFAQIGTGVYSFSAPLVDTGGVISIPAATTSVNGYLSSTDWTNFNTAYTNRITSLTTTGTSGAATLIANTLNIPQYAGATVGGSTGNIQYNDGTTFAGSNNLFWDNTNIRLGVAQSTPTSRFHLNFNQNSVTQSDANGILLANSTAAIAGTQSISPAIVWQGNGWKTNTTPSSQDVRFRADVLPVQGTTNPNATWRLSASVNGGSYTEAMGLYLYGATSSFVYLDVQSSNQGQVRTGTIGAANKVNGVTQIEAGNSIASGSATYKTTNAGSAIIPKIGAYSSNAVGTKYYGIDNTNGFTLSSFNSAGNAIVNASVDITGITTGANSEAASLIFRTQTGGTAMSEKMRVGGNGNVLIGTQIDGGFKLEVSGTAKVSGNLTTNITTTQIAYSSSGILSGSANLYWDNTNNYLVNRGYYFFEFPLTSGCGLVGRQQGTSNLLMQMGFNAQAQYGGTLGTVSGNQFFVYNFQEALGGANSYYWGFNNTGDNYWGSSNTAYSVRVQQPRAANIPLAIQGQTSQTGRLLTITTNNAATAGNVMSVFPNGNIGIGQTTDAGYKLDVNGTTRINSILYTTNKVSLNSQNGYVYRTTDAGSGLSSFTAGIYQVGTSTAAGNQAAYFDFSNTALTFAVGNSNSRLISRTGIGIANLNNTAGSEAGDMTFLTQSGGTAMSEKMRITGAGGLTINATNTATGTTGNQTINKASGTVNIAAAGTTVTVTNSLVTASSIVYAVIRTNDATATIKNVVPAAGSFVINLNAATTAETSIGFFVIN